MAHTARHADSRNGRGRACSAALALLMLVLAGCIGSKAQEPGVEGTGTQAQGTAPPAPPAATATPQEPLNRTTPPSLANETRPPAATGPQRLDLGRVNWTQGIEATGRCPCPQGMSFRLDPIPGVNGRTWLELRVLWDGALSAGVKPALVPPGGNLSLPTERGFDDWRIQAFAPANGTYSLDLGGSGDYILRVRLLSLDEPRGDGEQMLPDLVTLVPIDVKMGPCDEVETNEQGATRCLRLSNGIGNIGDGPVQVYLAFDRAAMALTPVTEGRFVQRLFGEDGAFQDVDVGPATLHLAHNHWHYASLAHFMLFSYDLATGLRGSEVSAHHKQGFCFLDWDRLESNDTDPSGGSNVADDCVVPAPDGWSMGLSRGYYDYYKASLTDEYVDVEGVPDGTYELVSVADGLHSLHELDGSNNGASVVLQLHGNKVKVIEERGHYRPQEYPGRNPVAR